MFKLWRRTYGNLSKGEKIFLFASIVFILLISSSYLIVGSFALPDQHYTGIRFVGGADKMVYLSQIEESRQGAWLVHNLYTSEPQPKLSFSPLWVFLGKFGALSGLSNLAVFELFRLLLGAVFLLLIYLFISRFTKQIVWRKITFFMTVLASGLGIFTLSNQWTTQYLYDNLGTDLWVSEGNTFLTLMHSPLFILSQIIILTVFWWLIERPVKAKWPEVILLGVLVLFLGIIHPYDLVIIYTVGGVWFLLKCFKKKKLFGRIFLKLLVIGVIGGLASIYFLWFKLGNPAFGGWLSQNITLSPRLGNYLIGYGLLFIFYLSAIYRAIKTKNKYIFFLAVWSIVGWILLFIPFQLQRRMANGLHLPIAMLASLGLIWLASKLKKTRFLKNIVVKYFIAELFCCLLLSSTLFMIAADIIVIRLGYSFNLSQDNYQAMLWLKNNLDKDEVILTSPSIGNIAPAYTGKLVYAGHGHQTNNWLGKKSYLENFFFKDNRGDEQKKTWLKANGIDYLFFGPLEAGLGDFDPASKDYLESVWQSGDTEIFRVLE